MYKKWYDNSGVKKTPKKNKRSDKMIRVVKVNFKFDEEIGRGTIFANFEITGIETKLEKEILKWKLSEFDIFFEEQNRLILESSWFVKSSETTEVEDLKKEIEEHLDEKKKKIKKTLKEAFELRRFFNNIIEEAE